MSNNLSSKRDLIRLLDSLLVPHAFVRMKDDWYLDNQECVSVIGLSKSLYGGQFYISIAFLLKELSPELLPCPPFHFCHFRQASQFIVPDQQVMKAALDLENDVASADRLRIITLIVTQFAMPLILRLSTKSVIASEYKTNENFAPYCNLDLKLALKNSGYLSQEDLNLDF
jgi:hypothetical protein